MRSPPSPAVRFFLLVYFVVESSKKKKKGAAKGKKRRLLLLTQWRVFHGKGKERKAKKRRGLQSQGEKKKKPL